jgi:hypothetical protein
MRMIRFILKSINMLFQPNPSEILRLYGKLVYLALYKDNRNILKQFIITSITDEAPVFYGSNFVKKESHPASPGRAGHTPVSIRAHSILLIPPWKFHVHS